MTNMPSNTPSDASKGSDYFSNHSLGVKWPFTIYHRPIEHSMRDAINAASAKAGSLLSVLVFGCGLFHEQALFSPDFTLTLADSDERLRQHLTSRISGFSNARIVISQSAADLDASLASDSFDLIIAKEVIEHITDMENYFAVFNRVLRRDGTLWMSTPNYGGFTLPLIEYTFLEVLARLQGFSRIGIHPNKYSRQRLLKQLQDVGFDQISIDATPLGLALVGSCQKSGQKSKGSNARP